ncbi:hypothetical protein EV715DRAFT_202103 [Schizophyllum commune]
MAYIVECNNRETISIPLGAIDLPPSPFGPPAVADEEQKWFTASDGCAGSGLLGTLRQLDRRSLFTGSVVDLEVAYLIPPPTDGEESSRAQVESLCNSLKLGGNDDTFRLDGLMNTFLLESSLRVHLDDHATFMIHMPLLEFARLCDQLRRDNEFWVERAKHDPSAERIFGSDGPSTHSYEIRCLAFYALSPAFLPDGATVPVLPNEHRTVDRPCLHAAPIHHRPRHAFDSICEFPYPPTHRKTSEKLSPLALAVNAHFKLQTWKARASDTENFILQQYCKFSDRFMDLLYFVPSASPEGSEDSAPSLVSSTLPGRSHLGAFSTIATVNDSDNEDDIDNDSDNDENTGYDLTAEELDIVARRASDRSLGTEERAEAALLLFGMAGYTLQPDNPLATKY